VSPPLAILHPAAFERDSGAAAPGRYQVLRSLVSSYQSQPSELPRPSLLAPGMKMGDSEQRVEYRKRRIDADGGGAESRLQKGPSPHEIHWRHRLVSADGDCRQLMSPSCRTLNTTSVASNFPKRVINPVKRAWQSPPVNTAKVLTISSSLWGSMSSDRRQTEAVGWLRLATTGMFLSEHARLLESIASNQFKGFGQIQTVASTSQQSTSEDVLFYGCE